MVEGIKFTIRKLSPLDFAVGAKVLISAFDTYEGIKESKKEQNFDEKMIEKVKDHYRDVFCQGIVSPKITRKRKEEDSEGIWVDHLFTDWDLAHGLYDQIMIFSNGKKKLRRLP